MTSLMKEKKIQRRGLQKGSDNRKKNSKHKSIVHKT